MMVKYYKKGINFTFTSFFVNIDYMTSDLINNYASKLGFLFVCIMIIASGYVTQVLPCQTQVYLQNGMMGKHIIGWLICFLFIMLEGGWSFNMEEQEKADVDWSNGNAIDTLIFGAGLYIIFLLTAKMKLIPSTILYVLLFSVYLINTQRQYWTNRNIISSSQNDKMITMIKTNSTLAIGVFAYGIIEYILYKKNEYGNKFSYIELFLTVQKCKSLEKK
jgi:hypothetical protein